ncbi:MAG TPA: histidine kinase dimerization/phospho-acceptor domain-containing protein [Candidatus Acidoferrales bacterium]|nr:histidine kinase dimerization/phospho-acceptor domain-containing protein [Candidatus Acidoferrales bacterium]
MTIPLDPSVLLICADPGLTRRYIAELASVGGPHQTPLATSLAQAKKLLSELTPSVILLDESGLRPEGCAKPIDLAASELTDYAPVVIVAASACHEALAFLVSAGAVDLVLRTGNFIQVAAGLVARRARIGAMVFSEGLVVKEPERDFGELLRHEVNNPLTGILGNAELLLKRRDRLPPHAVARLETIAELAVRLRETIRRLSDCWESSRGSAPLI